MRIIPAVLAKSFEEFQSMIRKIEPFADLIHLDIADGKFVPNKTIEGFEEMERMDPKLNFEIHLMINNPESVIGRWLKTPVVEQSSLRGTAKAVRYLVHRESAGDLESLINQIKESGKELGLVLNPQTDYSAIEPYLDRIDLIQFMTVDPGFYGSLFLSEVLEKIRNFHSRYPDKKIQVDGGINRKTIKLAEEAGASRAAVGSHIFKSDNIEKAIGELSV